MSRKRKREVTSLLKKVNNLETDINIYNLKELRLEADGWYIEAANATYGFTFDLFLGDTLEDAFEEADSLLAAALENRG